MLNALRKELAKLSDQKYRRDKIDGMVVSLRREEQTLLQKECDLRAILSKENADVERLEKTSLTSMICSALGKREARLEKEQQEAYAAKLKYDAALYQLEECQRQMDCLLRERNSLVDCDVCYQQVYDEILASLRGNTTDAIQLCEMENQLSQTNSQLREISQAISAGKACMSKIEDMERCLASAESWGTWDLLGGGLISDLAKHNHLNEAQSGAEQLQGLLSRFCAELADVKIDTHLRSVNVDGFLLFADYFFDGIIADWCVLSRINDSQKSVAQVKGQIAAALSQLQTLHTQRQQEKAEQEQHMDVVVWGEASVGANDFNK